MKARVKSTGNIVDVEWNGHNSMGAIYVDATHITKYYEYELDFDTVYDYWTRLEHTYAGMAMQGMANRVYDLYFEDSGGYTDLGTAYEKTLLKGHADILADISYQFAHALVEKLKEKEERK